MSYIHDNFLLQSKTAERLYHQYAVEEPILDFHSHLPVVDVSRNRRFDDLFQIWLEGDHYKWRAMRANGVPERFCTGNATPHEKFLAWARTVPNTLRNPLYQWTHLELKRYFDIDELLSGRNAEQIWRSANERLRTDELSACDILKKFKVRIVCTSDDPTESIEDHIAVNNQDLGFRLYPTFRPDKSLAIDQPDAFNQWVNRLESSAQIEISNLNALLDTLDRRHSYFHDAGCRLSDHGLPYCYSAPCTQKEANEIFAKARCGKQVSAEEHHHFASFMMLYFGQLDAKRGWTKQLHLGALRSANTRALQRIGPDTGFDSIGDWPQAAALSGYLNLLENETALPRMIIYNNNPADNYVCATAAGNFQNESTVAKIQFGSGWWFLDQKEGIEWQLNTLSNVGLLAGFVGMVTDSRSFMSFPRHEYFRRVLCNLLGCEMERGELPSDEALVGQMVRKICFENARSYLGLEMPVQASSSTTTAYARST